MESGRVEQEPIWMGGPMALMHATCPAVALGEATGSCAVEKPLSVTLPEESYWGRFPLVPVPSLI